MGSLTKESQPGAEKPLSSQSAGHRVLPIRLAQGEQTRSPEVSNHFTKMWVRKVNLSECRERCDQGMREHLRKDNQANVGCPQHIKG